jgi:hypothetical protein
MPSEETATQIIPDLGKALPKRAAAELAKRIRERKLIPDASYREANVYHLGDNQTGYIVLEQHGEVIYFVRYEAIKHNKLNLGRQVLVWRNKTSPASVGFASSVFFKELLPRFTALVADQQQTEAGQGFWQYALDKAFVDNLHVYYLDRRSTPNRLVPLLSMNDVQKHEHELWGDDEGHKRTFAVISKKPLHIKTD